MANLGRLFRVLPPLLFSILFFSSILSLATASLPQDDDDSGNGEIGPLLADLRASVYVALIPLCVFCSVLIEDFAEPIRSDDADGEEMSNIIRDRLLTIKARKYNGEDIPKDLFETECSNLVREQLAWILRAEATTNDPSRSLFLPKTSSNPRNILLYTVAAEIEAGQDDYNCAPEFSEADDELDIL